MENCMCKTSTRRESHLAKVQERPDKDTVIDYSILLNLNFQVSNYV
jgi:hypothetical protein